MKMLPEYADDMSRSEFLREIGLMKTLGYHERLVVCSVVLNLHLNFHGQQMVCQTVIFETEI